MSDTGNWFKLSRRDFARAAAASVIATAATGKVAGMSEENDSTTQPTTAAASKQATDEIIQSRVRWLEDQLGRAIPANLRDKVAKQIAGNDAMWKAGRKFTVPDGTEPAFVFQPVPHERMG
jgi:hypothetical protein